MRKPPHVRFCLRFVVPFAAMFWTGCYSSPTVTDNSRLVVSPGSGLPSLCEIGMSLSQIERATHDVTTHAAKDGCIPWRRWRSGRFAHIPSLGVVTFLGKDEPISHIEFHVQPYRSLTIPALIISRPFMGSVEGGLSFAHGAVTKDDVEKYFGKLPKLTDKESSPTSRWTSQQPFAWKGQNGIEEFMYLDKGITFVIQSNIVISFRVYSPCRRIVGKPLIFSATLE